jgi:hypothetical protein
MAEEPETRELRKAQQEREQAESEQADAADTREETAEHHRRAEKAAYLRQKLEERADSEDEPET